MATAATHEVTPKRLRLRKRDLDDNRRKSEAKASAAGLAGLGVLLEGLGLARRG